MSSPIETEVLHEWMLKVLTRKGQFAADAELVIARLLEAEQRGSITGGLTTFAEILTAIDLGDVDPRARTLTVTDAPAIAVLDGSTGIGQVGASRAMQLAVQKASLTGIALVVVKNSQPLVDVAGIAALAAKEHCLGFCTANWGKADRDTASGWLSSQPQAWAMPHGQNVWITSSNLSGIESIAAGVLSLVLTAGLTDSKLPAAKKRASPFGAGAEYACIAIHPATMGTTESLTRIGDELTASDGAAGWSAFPVGPLQDTFSLAPNVLGALIEAGQAARVPFPAA
ncbi:MAG TPA: Ldh family oxidoreductase [Planctomycetaceae bacterium]|jgi:hypothetical protein|nr:Ldh family oxidoreductase [Planctomycetaceae bacterium]